MDNHAPDAVGVVTRDASRRGFLGTAGRLAAVGGIVAIAACSEGEQSPLANYPTPTPSGTPGATPTPTPTPTILPVTDIDMLVMMAQLHYLQAEFYSRALLGGPLASSIISGTGTLGTVTGPRAVTIADPILADMLREIAVEKIDQVVRLRAVLGSAMPARPSLNLATDATGSFGMYAANAAQLGATATVKGTPPIGDVYANQEQFLLGAFLLEDVIVAGWRGVSTLMVSAANIEIAAGLMAASSFHSGLVRAQLFIRGGVTNSTLRGASIALSDLRDSYGGSVDDDRGVASSGSTSNAAADVNLSDGEGETYGRLPNLTINTVYMTRATATSGGFFPDGLNGVLRSSAAN